MTTKGNYKRIFRRAVEILDSGDTRYSCNAIAFAQSVRIGPKSPAQLYYIALMTEQPPEYQWLPTEQFELLPNSHEVRILALLIAGEVADSEGL